MTSRVNRSTVCITSARLRSPNANWATNHRGKRPMQQDRRGCWPRPGPLHEMRPPLRRRFYERAEAEEAEREFRVVLDGRPVKTPARRVLAAPTRALAEALAAEWRAQREVIDPAALPLTRLANSIIDGVA